MKPVSNRFLPKLLFVMMMLAFSGVNHNGGLHAQSSLGFYMPSLIGMPDTANSSTSTIQVGCLIKNYGFLNYNDTIRIGYGIDTTGNSLYTTYNFPPVYSFQLLPGDTSFFLLPFIFLDNHMGGNLRIGNNIIVVWPISYDPNFTTHDSIFANIFIIDPSSVPEYGQEQGVRFYPVPASGPLYVTTGTRSLVVKEVIVTDAAGKIIVVSDTPSLGIKTDDWASGIYLLEVTFENGQKSVYKIIR